MATHKSAPRKASSVAQAGSSTAQATTSQLRTRADWYFGAGDFTIDFWVRFNALPASGGYAFFWHQDTDANNYWQCMLHNDAGVKKWRMKVQSGGVTTVSVIVNAASLSTGVWYHLAFVRSGNNWMIFQDGTQCGTTVSDADPVPDLTGGPMIGVEFDGTNGLNGWLDEFRVSKGVARWTSNFTPPTSAYTADSPTVLLLHMDGANGSTMFFDSSMEGGLVQLPPSWATVFFIDKASGTINLGSLKSRLSTDGIAYAEPSGDLPFYDGSTVYWKTYSSTVYFARPLGGSYGTSYKQHAFATTESVVICFSFDYTAGDSSYLFYGYGYAYNKILAVTSTFGTYLRGSGDAPSPQYPMQDTLNYVWTYGGTSSSGTKTFASTYLRGQGYLLLAATNDYGADTSTSYVHWSFSGLQYTLRKAWLAALLLVEVTSNVLRALGIQALSIKKSQARSSRILRPGFIVETPRTITQQVVEHLPYLLRQAAQCRHQHINSKTNRVTTGWTSTITHHAGRSDKASTSRPQ
jgi:hypothetical protein